MGERNVYQCRKFFGTYLDFLWQSDREIEKKFLPVFRVASGRTCSGDKRKENLYFYLLYVILIPVAKPAKTRSYRAAADFRRKMNRVFVTFHS